MSPKLLRVKGYRARWGKTAISVGLIASGVAIVALCYQPAHISELERYKYGAAADWLPGFNAQQLAPLWLEGLFVLGYSLVLGGFAWIHGCWAASSFGRRTARYVFAAVVITAGADLVKDWFLHRLVHRDPHSAWFPVFSTGVSAAAVVKWCAALLALGGLAAVVGLTGRGAIGLFRRYVLPRIREDMREKAADGSRNYAYWWNDVWVQPKLPKFQDRVTSTRVAENQASWLEAYNVPGAIEIIDNRKDEPVQAICLSGGGVRSACVAMGATQAFSEAKPINPRKPDPPSPAAPRRLIDTVDYVISVSGGGYTAGARLLATQRRDKAPVAQPSCKRPAAEFPREAPGRPLLSQRFEQGSAEFDHFRRGSSYIADSPVELVNALAVVLRNLIASLAMLFTVPAVLGWVVGYLLAVPHFAFATFVPVTAKMADQIRSDAKCAGGVPSLVPHGASLWAVLAFVFLAVVSTMLAIVVEWFLAGPWSEAAREWLLKVARGNAVFAALVLVTVAGLPALMWLCSMVSPNPAGAGTILSGVVGLNYVAAIVAMVANKRDRLPLKEAVTPSWWKRLLPPGVLQLILVLGTFVLLALAWLAVLGSFAVGIFQRVVPYACQGGVPRLPGLGWLLELLGLSLAVVFLGFADVTSLSLHPFYRLRLARTFAVRRVEASLGNWQAERYPATEWTRLWDYGHAPPEGPKFIFATAATLSGEATPAPGLNAVSYVLSADYIGGPQLGWLNTQHLLDVAPPRIKRDLTVEASVAVSGAAFASAMGRQNKGYQKLLALSGARLGTWLPNPNLIGKLVCAQKGDCTDPDDKKRPWPTSLPTIRGAGYFYRELFGLNYDDARLVQLTDGGHYENLGLVEALRRRCRLIFCIDAGGDAPPLLSTLSDAMRLAEYELGVTIELNEQGPYSLNNIAPGSGRPFPEGHALARLNGRLTKGTAAFGKIQYPLAAGLTKPQNPRGVLIFAKAVLWEGCPEWLLTYAASSEVFPHDPTSDQWFNEAQFAAYTALGRIMGKHAVECAESLKRNWVI
jgi:hypothetical protein